MQFAQVRLVNSLIQFAVIIHGGKLSRSSIPLKQEIPGQSKVIPGSLDKLSKLVKSLDCPGHPWTVGNYGILANLERANHWTS